jgi:hypothetical protein
MDSEGAKLFSADSALDPGRETVDQFREVHQRALRTAPGA